MNEVNFLSLFSICIIFIAQLVYSNGLSEKNYLNAVSDRLYAGSVLKEGEFLQSNNKMFKVVLEDSGILTIYKLNYNPYTAEKLWESENLLNCYKKNNFFYLSMQKDGNLVIYSNHTVFWETSTHGHGRPKQFLEISNDGKLRIKDASKIIIWEAKEINESLKTIVPSDKLKTRQTLLENQYLISKNGKYMALMQSDGDVGIYNLRNKRMIRKWISNTKNKGFLPFKLVMTESGNLVLFDKYERRIWTLKAPNKEKTSNVELVMQNDGNLIHFVNYKIIWSSETLEK